MDKIKGFLELIIKGSVCDVSNDVDKTEFFTAVGVGGVKRIFFITEDKKDSYYSEVTAIGYYDCDAKTIYPFSYSSEFLSFFCDKEETLDDIDCVFAEHNIDIVPFKDFVEERKKDFNSANLELWKKYSSEKSCCSLDKVKVLRKCYYPSEEEFLIEDVNLLAEKAFEKAVKLSGLHKQ